jgi:hypothetical protein
MFGGGEPIEAFGVPISHSGKFAAWDIAVSDALRMDRTHRAHSNDAEFHHLHTNSQPLILPLSDPFKK